MCGRYASTRSAADLSALFEAADETEGALAPDYNVAPTDPVALVRHSARADGRVLSLARWGLVPSWAKDTKGGARMINARAETVATSRAFAQSFERRRCLVPADGWYEWLKRPDGKQPYFMTRPDGGPLAFAGLWSVWGSGDQRLLTISVITVAAVGDLAAVHDRMPLVLPPQRWAQWLAADDATGLLMPDTDWVTQLEIRPVGSAVGDVRNDGPELVRAAPGPAAAVSPAVHQSPSLF
ncbi:SOS response-associated peptidase [Luedemannella flava]|uniref:Abasic site processing protein n=1 Tax=Luedemannella flava TaxID=349316 RepID=A0ABN2MLW2_9ACTN